MNKKSKHLSSIHKTIRIANPVIRELSHEIAKTFATLMDEVEHADTSLDDEISARLVDILCDMKRELYGLRRDVDTHDKYASGIATILAQRDDNTPNDGEDS